MSVQATAVTAPTDGPCEHVSPPAPDNRKDETSTPFNSRLPSRIPDLEENSTLMSHAGIDGLPLDQISQTILPLQQQDELLNKSDDCEEVDSVVLGPVFQDQTSILLLDRLKSTARRLDHTTDQILVKQYDLEHQQQTTNQCLKFLFQSIKDLIDGAKLVETATDLDGWLTKFGDGDSQLHRDYDAFMHQTDQTVALRSQIIDLESQLKKDSGGLSKHLELPGIRIGFEGHRASQNALQEISSTGRSRGSSLRSETPPLLALYYDRKGDIGIYRERLQDLDYQFQDEIDIRNAVEERGDLLDVSDEQFNQDFLNKRDKILDDLSKAEKDAQILAERCREEGIQINEQRRDSSEAVSSHSGFSPCQEDVQVVSKHKPHESSSSTSSNHISSRRQIRKWLDTIDPVDSKTAPQPTRKASNDSTQLTTLYAHDPLRRSASFPQYRTTNRTIRLSVSRSHVYGDRDPQQEEATEFELITDWAERDARSLPGGTKEVDARTTGSRLGQILRWNPFNLGS